MSKKNGFAHLKTVASRSVVTLHAAAAIVALGATIGGAEAAPYQEFRYLLCPGPSVACEVVIDPAVPANNRVHVTSLSCFMLIAPNAQINEAFIKKQPGSARDFFVPIRTSSAGLSRYAYNGPTLFFADPGDRLSVYVYATGDMVSLGCKLAGSIVPLP